MSGEVKLDEEASAASEAVRAEMRRINAVCHPSCAPGDREDLITYAKEIVRLRAAVVTGQDGEGGWQTIESAPKDGTDILLCGTEWSVVQGRYVNDACRWFQLNSDPTDYYDGEIYQPTHWMPLPKAPGQESLNDCG